jgi:hypothetical protein
MLLTPHPPEKRAEARRLGATTILTCTEIAARVGVAASTVRGWKREEGWKRPPGAPERRTFTKDECEAIGRLRRLGGTSADIALVSGCHADTVSKIAPIAADARAAPVAMPEAATGSFAPDDVAGLYQTLTAGGNTKRDLLRLATRALELALVEALIGRDPHADRKAQGIARHVATINTLPDENEPAAGASSHDHQPPPATPDATNALLEELARRLEAFGARGESDGVSRDAAAGSAIAAQ